MIKELNYIVLHIGNYFVTSNPHYTEAGQELMGPLHSMQNSIVEQYDNLNTALEGFVNNHNWIDGRLALLAQQFISSDISNEQYQHEQQIYQDLKTTNENIQNIIKAAMNFIINHANVLTNQNGIMTALNSIEVQLEQSQFQPLKVNTAQNLALNNIQASENLNIFKEEVDKYLNIFNNQQLIERYNFVLSNLHALTNIVIGNLNEFTNQVNNRLFLLNREGGHGGEGGKEVEVMEEVEEEVVEEEVVDLVDKVLQISKNGKKN
ncbi:hypothetical protein Mgra_00003468 [Meloidogyne graminicola]|uniref:Uncharacterized protein n=1 Tax=Meloidogyne graminicola TaxID=189291 RepID=A0A8S9ZV91_9BILA|nr:hypothetical protein Mgra_00003468 [Meloidogyne graminicola]